MLAEVEALIRRVDHDGIAGQARLVEVVEHSPDVVVDRGDAAEVVLDVALILPADQVVALEGGLAKRFVLGFLGAVPRGRLPVGDAPAFI